MSAVNNNLIEQARFIIENLHFLRADWFYALIPLIIFLLLAYTRKDSTQNWQKVIDEKLQPFVLRHSSGKRRRYPLLLTFIAASLCITALAGPVYKELPQPVYREQSSLVILLDLSQSMNANDIKPSRLERAKLELLDILKTRKTGQTAFIVYAATAFVVTPLTDDNATIANLMPSLETSMMPAQGSNLSSALEKAYSLFTQAGIINGNLLVVTDDIHQRDVDAIEKIRSQGHRLSIFGIGTSAGSPIPLDGGFLQDDNGAIVIPKLDAARLQSYALKGGGLYSNLSADDSDVEKLSRLFTSSKIKQETGENETRADVWQEEGYWLLLPLLFFASLWARKGWLAIALIFILPLPQPAHAENTLLDTQNLWLTKDQKAMRAFDKGDNAAAAENFTLPEWKASAYYRDGNYQAAADTLKQPQSSDDFYNKANALAQLGQYPEAIAAYDRAIELDEKNDDAKYNREQVKNALQQQQQKQDSKQDSDRDSEKDDSQQSEQQSQQDSTQQDSEQQDKSQQQSSDQQDAAQQNDQQSDGDKDQQPQQMSSDQEKQAEEQELKQRNAEQEKQKQQSEQEKYQQDQKENAEQQQNQQQADDSIENREGEEKPEEIEINPVEASITEQQKATEQWLKRIPDDPGGLLKRKFLYQYNQIPDQQNETQPW